MRSVCAGALLAVALCHGASAETGSQPLPGWVTSGPVSQVERVGDTVYLGGSFRRIGARTGPGVPLSSATGRPAGPFPEIAGFVSFFPGGAAGVAAAESDGSGGWFVSGGFDLVGGVRRHNLVHIRSDGSVDPAFAPVPDRWVSDLELAGDVLYVAGDFASVSGVSRHGLAALNPATGQVLDWNPPLRADYGEADVYDVEAAGSTVYLAGRFQHVGDAERPYVAAVDASTGQATAFQAKANGPADTLAFADGTLYVAGDFTTINGDPRRALAAVDPATGALRPWNPAPTSTDSCCAYVNAIAPAGPVIYVGGDFDVVGGAQRRSVAALDATSGSATSWDAHANEHAWVEDIAVADGRVHLAGTFTTEVGGHAETAGVATLDAANPNAGPWAPLADGPATVVEHAGGIVYAGGSFASADLIERPGLAALDAHSGEPRDWTSPLGSDLRHGVTDMEAYDGALYLSFPTLVGNDLQQRLAAIDLETGQLTRWDPSEAAPERRYGRVFQATARGVLTAATRRRGRARRPTLTLLDRLTGAPTSFDVELPGYATRAVVAGDQVIVARYEETDGVMVEARRLADGAPCWRTHATGTNSSRGDTWVGDLAVVGGRVYVSGDFIELGGRRRSNLAAVSVRSGRVLPWSASGPAGGLMAAAGGVLYVAAGGPFLREVHAQDGRETGFAPGFWGGTSYMYDTPPWTYDIEPSPDGLVHIGGEFRGTSTANTRGYAAFPGAPTGWSEPPVPDCDDSVRPALSGAVRSRSLARARRRGIVLRLRSNEAARAVVSVTARGTRGGRGRASLDANRVKRVRVPMSRRARRAFADARRLRVTVTVRATDRSGNRRELRLRRVLRRR